MEGEEIHNHLFKDHPFMLLEKYPGVRQMLEQRVEKTKDVLGWRELDTLIQYEGWTCNLVFHWRYSRGKFHVESVKLFKVCKAPPESEQMELIS